MKGEPRRILIVDDEEVIRSGCRQILEMNGYQVDEAINGREGLEKVRRADYDAVLTDLLMPEMDGMQLLEELSRLPKDVVVIIITGYATIENAVRAGRHGAFDYLPKPFNAEELLAKVEKATEHYDHLAELLLGEAEQVQDQAVDLLRPRGKESLLWLPTTGGLCPPLLMLRSRLAAGDRRQPQPADRAHQSGGRPIDAAERNAGHRPADRRDHPQRRAAKDHCFQPRRCNLDVEL